MAFCFMFLAFKNSDCTSGFCHFLYCCVIWNKYKTTTVYWCLHLVNRLRNDKNKVTDKNWWNSRWNCRNSKKEQTRGVHSICILCCVCINGHAHLHSVKLQPSGRITDQRWEINIDVISFTKLCWRNIENSTM